MTHSCHTQWLFSISASCEMWTVFQPQRWARLSYHSVYRRPLRAVLDSSYNQELLGVWGQIWQTRTLCEPIKIAFCRQNIQIPWKNIQNGFRISILYTFQAGIICKTFTPWLWGVRVGDSCLWQSNWYFNRWGWSECVCVCVCAGVNIFACCLVGFGSQSTCRKPWNSCKW